MPQGNTLNISSDEGYLRIYNNFDCKVAVSDSSGDNFSIEPIDVFNVSYNPVHNETSILSIDVDHTCQLKTSTLKQQVSVIKGKVRIMNTFYINKPKAR